jgi:ubiquitin carboxyl-terminal hydrolase L3
MGYEKQYVPLESDPAIFTELMHALGVSDRLEFIDVLSIQNEELGMIPRPVLALIVIFPEEDTAKTIDSSSETCLRSREYPNEIMWFEQTIDNACGLYALLHAVCNGAASGFVRTCYPVIYL